MNVAGEQGISQPDCVDEILPPPWLWVRHSSDGVLHQHAVDGCNIGLEDDVDIDPQSPGGRRQVLREVEADIRERVLPEKLGVQRGPSLRRPTEVIELHPRLRAKSKLGELMPKASHELPGPPQIRLEDDHVQRAVPRCLEVPCEGQHACHEAWKPARARGKHHVYHPEAIGFGCRFQQYLRLSAIPELCIVFLVRQVLSRETLADRSEEHRREHAPMRS
mmetsp:Transcript_38869/g.121100  ORF Transcript_38869/g.121100 Transcript_38869/m.121100 type:complete len:220 (+) Transcript_38869:448-1107(+)